MSGIRYALELIFRCRPSTYCFGRTYHPSRIAQTRNSLVTAGLANGHATNGRRTGIAIDSRQITDRNSTICTIDNNAVGFISSGT